MFNIDVQNCVERLTVFKDDVLFQESFFFFIMADGTLLKIFKELNKALW